MLRESNTHSMAHAATELTEQRTPAFEAAQPALSHLLIKTKKAEGKLPSVAALSA